MANSATNTGGSDFFTGLQGAARLLAKKGDYEEGLAVLDRADPAKLAGSWASSLKISRAEVLAAAGRKDEAATIYREIVDDPAAQRAIREKAGEALEN